MLVYKPAKYLLCILTLLFHFSLASASTEVRPGEIIGAVSHPIPEWFKDSFLEIADDVDEATDSGKHVMLFFHLEACPYCTRMLVESFEPKPQRERIQENFDVIEINIKGDRMVQFTDTLALSEKQLSETLQVHATPAIIFLNKNNEFISRINGYRAPQRFSHVLDYISSRSYETASLADYFEKYLQSDIYKLRDHHLFSAQRDLSKGGLLAVIVEDSRCHDCAEFHDKRLVRDDVLQQLEKFTVVRINAEEDSLLIDLDGSELSVKDFVARYSIQYRPGILLIDESRIIRRYDSLPFSYHFREGLRFVAEGFYKHEAYEDYSKRRRDELIAAGVDINYQN